jgi:SAM-dependent methyltransferase
MSTLEAFEALVLSQQPATEPWQPTTAVPYDFESRKQVEGRHPELIRDVFQPKRVLDVGCGPGHLVRLLEGLGIDATGCDSNPDRYSDTPYIFIEDITDEVDPYNYNKRGFDLVICREVLEHLTLLEIRKAVTHLCALSSKFVYGTTRFSSEHDIFRVETSDHLDPTHITIASKDLLRLLSVLEGFKWRGDLAAQMDWKGYGRTFVFERV